MLPLDPPPSIPAGKFPPFFFLHDFRLVLLCSLVGICFFSSLCFLDLFLDYHTDSAFQSSFVFFYFCCCCCCFFFFFFLVELILWGCCLKIFIHRLIRMSMGHFLEFYSYRLCLHDFSWLNFFMIYKIMQVKHRNRDFLALNSCFLTLLVWESVASRGTEPDFGSVRCSRTSLIHGGVGGWSYHQRIWQHCHKLWD